MPSSKTPSASPDLLVAVPSRGRPENVARLVDAMAVTCTLDTHLLLGLDADDPALPAYMAIKPNLPMEIVVEHGLRQAVAWINHLVMPKLDAYPFVGHIGDDNVPMTVGWDERIVHALSRVPFAFGNDLLAGRPPGSLCCHIFTRSVVPRVLGYLALPFLRHGYCDDAWMEWGRALGIEFLRDVILEHRHYCVGKAPQDDTYRDADAALMHDLGPYREYLTAPNGLDADIQRIRRHL